ncbi:MAG: LysM peptidoglycan-binding domain-containing protein, partial [Myxococcales bacterium]|nr:LysM peptidoglycan-binding domain-containing protein [Myxococcales bacterium]
MLRRAPHLDDDRAAPLARSALGLRTLGLRTLGLLTLGQLALGCGAEETPGGAEAPPAAAAASPSVQAAVDAAATSAEELPCVEHEVAEGETLWHIARAYELTVAEIVEFNGLRPRDIRRLSKGRTLRIPGVREPREVRRERPPTLEELPALEDGAYHLISEGETLWDIARTYDKRVDELLERNGWSDEEVRSLRPGRAVIIPGIRQQEVRQASAEPGRGGVRGIRHTVRAGETIWDLARSFRVSVSELMAANALDAAGVGSIREGARLWIPGVAQDAGGGSVRRELSGRQRRALAHAARLGLGTRQAAQRLLRGQADARWIRAARGRRGRFAGTLAWPVTHGRYVRGYGSGEGGYHLAVDVAGDIGWNVRASAAGIVAYSGDEVPGY